MLYSLTKEELNTDRNVIEAMNGFYDDTGDFNTVITSDLELSLGRMILSAARSGRMTCRMNCSTSSGVTEA